MLTGAVFALALVVAVVIAGTTLAQRGQYGHIYVQAEGDSRVVAVVQSKDLVWGEVRQSAQLRRELDRTMTENESLSNAIVPAVENLVLAAEVERRGLVPPDEETQEFIVPIKEVCLSPEAQLCRDTIEDMGVDLDEYWTIAYDDYRGDLGESKLYQARYAELGITDASDETGIRDRDKYVNSLRSDATIVWKDEPKEVVRPGSRLGVEPPLSLYRWLRRPL